MAVSPPRSLARRRRYQALLFLAPALALLALVAGYPLLSTFRLAFTDAELSRLGEAEWIGLLNFSDALTDPYWWQAVRVTLLFAAASVSIQLVLGLGAALLLDRSLKGGGLLRTALLLPWAIPTVVAAVMWRWLYADLHGVINAVARSLGLIERDIAWLAEPGLALAAVVVADVWKATPFVALLLLAGLKSLPQELYEAARVDGAGRLARFRDVTLPLLLPAVGVALVFRTLDALRVFDMIYVMTSNSRDTATVSIYTRQQLIDFQDAGYGSALSILVFLLVGFIVVALAAAFRLDRGLAR